MNEQIKKGDWYVNDESKKVKEGGELFTGGEWEILANDFGTQRIGVKKEYPNYINIASTFNDTTKEETSANAALIAQSKNMYYELKRVKKQCAEMVEWLDGGNKDFSVEEMLCSIANGITEILKKANPNY